MRTEAQLITDTFNDVRRAIRTIGVERGGTYNEVEAQVQAFNSALSLFESAAWRRGFDLGAEVVQRNAQDIIAQAALAILGKDRADGPVDLGKLGERTAV